MGRQKVESVEYSAAWFRPVDTLAGKSGWFVDKRITLRINNLVEERRVESIAFPDRESAEKFARSHYVAPKPDEEGETDEE